MISYSSPTPTDLLKKTKNKPNPNIFSRLFPAWGFSFQLQLTLFEPASGLVRDKIQTGFGKECVCVGGGGKTSLGGVATNLDEVSLPFVTSQRVNEVEQRLCEK